VVHQALEQQAVLVIHTDAMNILVLIRNTVSFVTRQVMAQRVALGTLMVVINTVAMGNTASIVDRQAQVLQVVRDIPTDATSVKTRLNITSIP